ncbi:MAG: HDIG domain-containing metalloprotein [Bacteroidota bacterium]
MKKVVSFIRHSHPELYRALLFVIAIAVVVGIFPKQGKFRYEFQNLKGKPWFHEDLIAPFDFAIKKTAEELANEKAGILKNFKPYFKVDTKMLKVKKEELMSLMEQKWDERKGKVAKQRTIEVINDVLDTIYTKGIIEPADVIENRPIDYSINVLNENVAVERDLVDFFTLNGAYTYAQKRLNAVTNIDAKFASGVLEKLIDHSILYDKATSDKIQKQAIEEISPSRDIILKDQAIVSKGELVDLKKYQILQSLKSEYDGQSVGTGSYLLILIGQLLIVSLCLSVLIAFLAFFRKDIFQDNTKITLILLLMVLQVSMANLGINYQSFSIYILPFCVLPIIIRSFFDTRVALFVHLVTVLIIAFMAPNRFEFAFIELLGGMVAIFSIVNMRNRSQIFISSVIIFLTYCVAFTGITIIQEGGVDVLTWFDYAWFGVSATLTLFSYPLIFIFEKIFGLTSDVSLLELSDTNGKLLRELAYRAPGTFQHSLQVANLAEDAIFNIGGNALLVRTGALYHDIGKMEMPMYFIENQSNGINPHDEMSFDESATIIIGHVIKGIEIAKKHKLPEQIIDFIRTHHGTTLTSYFYRSFQKAFPNEEIDEAKFHYPGPIPFSKETAVLMMADSVEAASRSLKKYDAETIDNLVERIISFQISQNQFVNADVTFRDINTIKKIFKKKLMNVYHVRVEYPR